MAVHGKGMQEMREEGGRICSGEARRKFKKPAKELVMGRLWRRAEKKMKRLDIVGKRGRGPEEVRKGMRKKSLISGILESLPCGSLGKLGQWSAFFQSPDLAKIPDISRPSHLQYILDSTLTSMI